MIFMDRIEILLYMSYTAQQYFQFFWVIPLWMEFTFNMFPFAGEENHYAMKKYGQQTYSEMERLQEIHERKIKDLKGRCK